jgi:NAD-dependent SIR2 family protein deacetylase
MYMVDTTQKTVYFLGAGASAASDFKLPTMEKFFEGANFTAAEYKNLQQFIEYKFSCQPIENLNLEEVVTTIELSLDTFGALGKHPEPYIYEARTELNKYVANRLEIDTSKGCKTLEKIITPKMAGGSSAGSIITLNYDLVIDTLITKHIPKESESLLGRTYDLLGYDPRGSARAITDGVPIFYSRDGKTGFYLKLHGSIDWLYCLNPNCGHHQIFWPNRLDDKDERAHSEPGAPCTLCGMPIVSVIIPPTMHKTFEKFPKLGFLWSLAYRELNIADKIVVFGVSFAPSDYYLRWLFKKAITDRKNKPTIIDIDKDSKVCDKIEKITGVTPEYFPTLEEYLNRASKSQT